MGSGVEETKIDGAANTRFGAESRRHQATGEHSDMLSFVPRPRRGWCVWSHPPRHGRRGRARGLALSKRSSIITGRGTTFKTLKYYTVTGRGTRSFLEFLHFCERIPTCTRYTEVGTLFGQPTCDDKLLSTPLVGTDPVPHRSRTMFASAARAARASTAAGRRFLSTATASAAPRASTHALVGSAVAATTATVAYLGMTDAPAQSAAARMHGRARI